MLFIGVRNWVVLRVRNIRTILASLRVAIPAASISIRVSIIVSTSIGVVSLLWTTMTRR
jgi:hypothetical protein